MLAHLEQAGMRTMPKNMLDGGQVIVDYLVREKVPYVFGLCGHGNIAFIDALYERSDDIKTISVHHETVAGFMADVYYRVAGRPTATFTSCGPGSANLPIALANSYLDSVRSWRSPETSLPANSTAGRSRSCTANIRQIFPRRCAPAANACSSRRAATWCRSRSVRPGRPW
jgi:TPP-dependent trihydroxycyclohexane-1,2-dione (THcHDO) dehydratase